MEPNVDEKFGVGFASLCMDPIVPAYGSVRKSLMSFVES
jgi:hypothetical protein